MASVNAGVSTAVATRMRHYQHIEGGHRKRIDGHPARDQTDGSCTYKVRQDQKRFFRKAVLIRCVEKEHAARLAPLGDWNRRQRKALGRRGAFTSARVPIGTEGKIEVFSQAGSSDDALLS